jgi:hypothetical protein
MAIEMAKGFSNLLTKIQQIPMNFWPTIASGLMVSLMAKESK